MTEQRSRHTYLKIKLLALAAEARLIRREEQRWPGEHPIRYGLHEHRILDVRREARSTCLTYGFLRSRPYRTLEATCHRQPDWERVKQIAEKYGAGRPQDIRQRLAEWIA